MSLHLVVCLRMLESDDSGGGSIGLVRCWTTCFLVAFKREDLFTTSRAQSDDSTPRTIGEFKQNQRC